MGILEIARQAYSAVQLKGPAAGSCAPCRRYEVNEVNEESAVAQPVTRQDGGHAARPTVFYRLVTRPGQLKTVIKHIGTVGRIALDTETTGLNPRKHKVRLLQLGTPDNVFIVDLFAIDRDSLRPLWQALADKLVIGHNLAFDLQFLARLGMAPVPARFFDTLLASRLLTAGTREANGLADVAKRQLGISLNKTSQVSDWTSELSLEQLNYAAVDVQTTLALYDPLQAKIKAADLDRIADLENRALPAFVWMALHGVGFDADGWEALATDADTRVAELTTQLNSQAPARDTENAWNWRSPVQVKAVFAQLGISLDSTADEVLARVNHPLAVTLREHRKAAQLVKAFGRSWLLYVDDGRLFPGWNQLGTAAGRSSCREPNAQQVPRDARYRRCFRAPEGRVFIKADYSQLQLRIAAKLSGDAQMMQAFQAGNDLHKLTAQALTGKTEVSKADRQLAKIINFGLLFGLSAAGLQRYAQAEYGITLTLAEARAHREAFFTAYPGLADWHREAQRLDYRARMGFEEPGESRTILGRRRLFDRKTPFTFRVNSPTQGSEADGCKLAMGLLWERRQEAPCRPVLFVHDEIVVEADADRADSAADWLKAIMKEAMEPILKPIPVEVETTIAPTWGQ